MLLRCELEEHQQAASGITYPEYPASSSNLAAFSYSIVFFPFPFLFPLSGPSGPLARRKYHPIPTRKMYSIILREEGATEASKDEQRVEFGGTTP
jgi:hypothetical protein